MHDYTYFRLFHPFFLFGNNMYSLLVMSQKRKRNFYRLYVFSRHLIVHSVGILVVIMLLVTFKSAPNWTKRIINRLLEHGWSSHIIITLLYMGMVFVIYVTNCRMVFWWSTTSLNWLLLPRTDLCSKLRKQIQMNKCAIEQEQSRGVKKIIIIMIITWIYCMLVVYKLQIQKLNFSQSTSKRTKTNCAEGYYNFCRKLNGAIISLFYLYEYLCPILIF